MQAPIITFGEVMGRITPAEYERFVQELPGDMEITCGGREANVAASLVAFGANVSFVSALPKDPVADACVRKLNSLGIDTAQIIRTDTGQMGLYYPEVDAHQRSTVVYNRENSALMLTQPDAYDWEEIFDLAGWFHFTGITPALSDRAANAVLEAVRAASEAEATISCDLSFRKRLWNWHPGVAPQELAHEVMRQLLPYVDIVIANAADIEQVLGIKIGVSDMKDGRLPVDAYCDMAARIVEQFPNLEKVAIILRQGISASHNRWGGLLYDADSMISYLAPQNADGEFAPYEIWNIVDRVGPGDVFTAGLIYALSTSGLDESQTAIRFATAASCLKHSIAGDFNFANRAEVEALMGASAGRIDR